MAGKFFVGTSGWAYLWTNFYPSNLPTHKRLSFYSQTFKTVEINYSFYHLPRITTYINWSNQTPSDFIFTLKLSRFITHIKKLVGVKVALRKFLSNAKVLGSKLGPILIQLPPSFKIAPKTIENFLEMAEKVEAELKFSQKLQLAFEFRHRSWFEINSAEYAAVIKILRKYKAAFVFAHSSRYPYPEKEPLTANFVYLRFHGPSALFASPYRLEGLKPWFPKIKKWITDGLDVYVYFNNDFNGYAVDDAKILLREIKK